MNIVRRLLSSSSAGSSTDIPNVEGGGETVDHMADHLTRHQETTIKTPEQELLGLSHLKKLHLDYVTSDKISPQEKETKLFAMLPLFCNIFSNQGSKVITEKFSEDIIPFTQAASRLLVTEVRRRASKATMSTFISGTYLCIGSVFSLIFSPIFFKAISPLRPLPRQ